MTKIYPIIHLNDKICMIEKNSVFTLGGKYIDDTNTVRTVVVDDPEYWKARSDYNIVLASNDEGLNLPLLPKVEEIMNIDTAFDLIKPLAHNKEWQNLSKSLKEKILKIVKECYKAASSKKYTEEDMHNAFSAGAELSEFSEPAAGDITPKWKNSYEYLQSLNPKPIAVEVEMETRFRFVKTGQCMGGEVEGYNVEVSTGKPKVDQNNFVIVKRWIYE